MSGHLWSAKRTGAGGIFLLASVLYINGVAPTIAWRDASEFVTVVHSLGIAHPAGSPTYALLAKLTTFLPIGSIALRVNLFSALLGALAVALLYALLYDLLAASPLWHRVCAAVSGALFLLFSESFWRFSEVAEVYTLQNCLLIGLTMVLLKARQFGTLSPTSASHFYWLFAFLYGLSAGVHATMALFAPAFLTFIWLTEPHQLRPQGVAFLAFFFLLGFAVFLYLPLRSLRDPVFDWGDPQTWHQFLVHILDRKDAAVISTLSWSKLPHQISVYLANLANEFSTLGIALGLLGCLYVFYLDKPLGLLLGLIFLGNVGFFVRSWTAAFGFLPSFVIFALWIGYGVHAGLRGLVTLYQRQRLHIPRGVVHAGLLGGIVITLTTMGVRHAAVAMQTDNYSAEVYGKELLAQLPFDAVLFSQDAWFTLLYLQHIERRRPDLTVLLQGEVFTPQYFAPLSRARYPYIRLTAAEEPVAMSTGDYFWYLSRINQEDHPLFWDPEPDFQQLFPTHLLPQGLLFAFHPSRQSHLSSQALRDHRQLLARAVSHIARGDRDGEAAQFLARKLQLLGLHFKRRGLLDEAARMYQMGLRLQPDNHRLHNNYGNLLMSQGKLQQALAQLNTAYSENPVGPSINRNLGIIMLSAGNDARAVDFFKRSVSFGGADGNLYLLLGESYIKLSRYAKAADALRAALRSFEQPGISHDTDDQLQQKKTWALANLRRIEKGAVDLIPLTELE